MKIQNPVIFVEKFEINMLNIKKYRKVKDNCPYTCKYRRTAYNICNLKYSIPKEHKIFFQSWSNNDYHLAMERLVEEFEQ